MTQLSLIAYWLVSLPCSSSHYVRKRRKARGRFSQNDGSSEQPSRQSHQTLGNHRQTSTKLSLRTRIRLVRVGKFVDELVGKLVNEWLANITRVLLSTIITRESKLASFLARRECAGSRSRADQIKKIPGDAINKEDGRVRSKQTITRRYVEGASSVERRSQPAPSSSLFSLVTARRACQPTRLATIGRCFFDGILREFWIFVFVLESKRKNLVTLNKV